MSASGLPEKLRDLIGLTEPMERSDRIQFLIDIAERYEKVPEEIATKPYGENHRIPHCESEAFVWAVEQPDRTLKFHFAVENPQGISAMAMAVILDETLSGTPPVDVAQVPPDIIYHIFGRELSMGKSMGLTEMVSMVRNFARLHAGPQETNSDRP